MAPHSSLSLKVACRTSTLDKDFRKSFCLSLPTCGVCRPRRAIVRKVLGLEWGLVVRRYFRVTFFYGVKVGLPVGVVSVTVGLALRVGVGLK